MSAAHVPPVLPALAALSRAAEVPRRGRRHCQVCHHGQRHHRWVGRRGRHRAGGGHAAVQHAVVHVQYCMQAATQPGRQAGRQATYRLSLCLPPPDCFLAPAPLPTPLPTQTPTACCRCCGAAPCRASRWPWASAARSAACWRPSTEASSPLAPSARTAPRVRVACRGRAPAAKGARPRPGRRQPLATLSWAACRAGPPATLKHPCLPNFPRACPPAAPGQPTLQQLSGMYGLKQQRRDTAVLGIVGNPVSHRCAPGVCGWLAGWAGLARRVRSWHGRARQAAALSLPPAARLPLPRRACGPPLCGPPCPASPTCPPAAAAPPSTTRRCARRASTACMCRYWWTTCRPSWPHSQVCGGGKHRACLPARPALLPCLPCLVCLPWQARQAGGQARRAADGASHHHHTHTHPPPPRPPLCHTCVHTPRHPHRPLPRPPPPPTHTPQTWIGRGSA